MQLYQFEYRLKTVSKISGEEIVHPTKHEWFGSERAATVRRLELYRSGELAGRKKDNPIWPVDVPTRKEDLLAWLNKNAV